MKLSEDAQGCRTTLCRCGSHGTQIRQFGQAASAAFVRTQANRHMKLTLEEVTGVVPMRAWEVLQNGTVVCSYRMGLTRQQALNKIENEERMKHTFASWSIRQSKYAICPACQCVKDEDGCGCNPEGA